MVQLIRVGCLLLFVLFVLVGCNNKMIFKRSQYLMGTIVDITVVAADSKTAHAAITAGFVEIKRLEKLLSKFDTQSDVSRVNQGIGTSVKVSDETIEIVEKSFEITKLTAGAFNVMVGAAVKAWNITNSPDSIAKVPDAKDLAVLKGVTGVDAVIVDSYNKTILLKSKKSSIDLGGIAKGYAADLTVAILKAKGINAGMVAVAGDIMAFGRKPNGSLWRVGIRSPRGGGIFKKIDLDNQAISTSGDYERFFEKDGKRYHHILDPSTLSPAMESISVSVISKHGYLSDGLSTGLFVAGYSKGKNLLKNIDDVEVIFVDSEGNVYEVGANAKVNYTLQVRQYNH